ncbi:MAG: IS66 family insertion sequence element accessory protein TnpA [Minwuia sp.]|uniref:IS66 family insertion sequence element accessory protein TnpA n=1 Tax=Minwuia sp. TaxID=2493630 RepID=UPI003A87D16C
MADDRAPRRRHGEAFWRAHHEAWKRSDLNQREFCEAHRIPLKALRNWRAKFNAEPEAQGPRLLYRHGGISHSHAHGTYPPSALLPKLVEPPPRAGHRRRFGEADRHRILAEASMPGAIVSEIARRYGIARRVMCRWRQDW